MIETHGTALAETDPFEDAIHATAYIATVHVRYGELVIPPRVLSHLADGPVFVHLVRGEEDVAVMHQAEIVGGSKVTGIEWPEDVTPGTRVTVMCPRGSATHDIAVLLPLLAEPLHYAYVEDDREAAPVAEDVDPIELVETSEANEPGDFAVALVEAEHADDCTGCGGPDQVPCAADRVIGDFAYRDGQPIKNLITGELLDEPTWPGNEELADQEVTDLLPIVVPEIEERAEPGTVYSAALVAAKAVDEQDDDEDPLGLYDDDLDVLDLDHDYRPRWRRALAFVRINATPTRAVFIAATGGTFVGSLVTWLVTR